MSGGDRVLPRALACAAALSLAGSVGLAQSGDFGGSFDTDAPEVTVTPETVPDLPDTFGGNFEEGSADAGGPSGTQPPPSEETAPPPASGEVTGGSFDPDFGTGGADAPAPDVAEQDPEPETAPETTINVPEEVFAFEARDYGVKPPTRLRQSDIHAPTPNRLPGGALVSTAVLAQSMIDGVDFILIDVLGDDYSIPGAYVEPLMASAGSFDDRIQQQTQQWLDRLTDGDRGVPIVIYCSDPMCWLSYNAGLRAVNAGFSNVYWYRGGLQAWMMANLPVEPSGF